MWKEGVRERQSEGLGVGWVEGGRVGCEAGRERGGGGGERQRAGLAEISKLHGVLVK